MKRKNIIIILIIIFIILLGILYIENSKRQNIVFVPTQSQKDKISLSVENQESQIHSPKAHLVKSSIFGNDVFISSDFKLVKRTYQTPAMSYEGIPGDIVGYALEPNFSDVQDDIIFIGGRQVNMCGNEFNLNYSHCHNKKIGNDLVPVYTNSGNEKVLSFFELFTN